jgi:hypothetical protein
VAQAVSLGRLRSRDGSADMTVNVNLDEALDQPLFEGPLQLFPSRWA